MKKTFIGSLCILLISNLSLAETSAVNKNNTIEKKGSSTQTQNLSELPVQSQVLTQDNRQISNPPIDEPRLVKRIIPSQFEDQFSQAIEINEITEWIVFASDKKSSEIVRDLFLKKEISDLSKLKVFYVADISAMPGLVTSMFAIPKMKKYPFKIALDRTGSLTKDWPRKENAVTVMRIQKEMIQEIDYAISLEEFDKLAGQFLK